MKGDLLALIGAILFILGFYLILGTAPALMLAGALLVYTGWRIESEAVTSGDVTPQPATIEEIRANKRAHSMVQKLFTGD